MTTTIRLVAFLLPLALVPNGASGADAPATRFVGKLVAPAGGATSPAFVSGGKTYLLVENDASRLLFKDKELRGREFVLTGTAAKGGLSVTAVRAVAKGKEFDVYYWCDNCELGYSEPGACLCCGSAAKRVEVEAGAKGGLPKLLKPN